MASTRREQQMAVIATGVKPNTVDMSVMDELWILISKKLDWIWNMRDFDIFKAVCVRQGNGDFTATYMDFGEYKVCKFPVVCGTSHKEQSVCGNIHF